MAVPLGIEGRAPAGMPTTTGVSYASAVGDVDGDGDLDLLESGVGTHVKLFINHEGGTRHWVKYRVVGQTTGNRHGVGTRVRTRVGLEWQLREVLAGGNGYLGQNELVRHVGLDGATMVTEIEVTWPGGDTARSLFSYPADTTWTLYPPERLGDADGDGIVDAIDFATLAACFGGPVGAGCEVMDFDGDGTIGTLDGGAFFGLYVDPTSDCNDNGRADQFDLLVDPGLDADGSGVLDSCEAVGDFDGSGTVGVEDLLILLAGWGPCAACPVDLDGDGTVGIQDLLLLLSGWS
jgi:hypothetical protein